MVVQTPSSPTKKLLLKEWEKDMSILIDWISVTYSASQIQLSDEQPVKTALRLAPEITGDNSRWTITKGMFGYRHGVRSENGSMLYFSDAASTMGVHMSYSGSSLSKLEASLFKYHVLRGAKFTRLDVSIDFGGALSIRKLKTLFDVGRSVTQSRTCKLLEGTSGTTLYIGSRTSQKYLRIYDKRAEQKQPRTAPDWYRIVLELRDETAHGVAHYLSENGLEHIPDDIRGFSDFPTYPTWIEAMDTANTVRIASERKMSDTRKWLIEQVAGSVAREAENDPEFWETFKTEVDALRWKIKANSRVLVAL